MIVVERKFQKWRQKQENQVMKILFIIRIWRVLTKAYQLLVIKSKLQGGQYPKEKLTKSKALS